MLLQEIKKEHASKKATLVVLVLQARQLLLVILIPRPLLLAVMAQHLLGGAGDLLRRLVLPAMTPRRPLNEE